MEKSIYTREYSVFIEQLRKVREIKNLTQAEVAERLSQTQSFVSKVERGERRIDIVELRAFCRAIDISFREFVTEIDQLVGEEPNNKDIHDQKDQSG